MASSSKATNEQDDRQTGDRLRVDCCDGKYTVVQRANGGMYALRHGQEWRDCVGDGLILGLAQDLEEAREQARKAKLAIDYAIMRLDGFDRLQFLQQFARGEQLHDFPDWPEFLASGGEPVEPESAASVFD